MTADAHPPSESSDGPAPLGGRARTIRFPPYWHVWFARQSEPRLTALDELIDAQIERRMLRTVLCRLKHAVVVAFVAAAAAAHWFSDQLAWLADRLPVLRLAWKLVAGDP